MSESSPEIVAPTSGYYAARMHKIDKRLWPRSLKNIRVRLAEHAEVYRKAYRDSLLLISPPPDPRENIYIARTPEEWAALQAQFPDIYEREMKDFGRLVERGKPDEEL